MNIWNDIKKLIKNNPNLRFWWRDDDMIEPTEQGDRLMSLSGRHNVPLTLAIIPVPMDKKLPAWLASYEDTPYNVAQHGLSHLNKAGNGWKKCELVSNSSHDAILAAKDKLSKAFGDKLKDMIVPPWNRFDPEIESFLIKNYAKISTFKAEKNDHYLNTHLDLICWKNNYRALSPEILYDQLKSYIAEGHQGPLGILTHHLVHDEAHWDVLEKTLEAIGADRFIVNPTQGLDA